MINVTKPSLPSLRKYVEYLERIWNVRWLTNNGELLKALESRLREYLKAQNVVLVSNGTLALHLAFRSLKLKGEVITTPFTFAATTNILVWEGLTPVFGDIDKHTFNLDPSDVENKITDKTSAILAVHVYGNPCDVHELQKIAKKHDLKLIYDGAHAFGVEYDAKPITDYGDITTLSFHATKVFNTIEGGALVVKNKEIAKEISLLRDHGIASEEHIELPGTNAKMNEFQAAMGLCNLDDIKDKIQKRKKIYELYRQELEGNVVFQRIMASKYNFSYMPLCLKNFRQREETCSELVRNGIKSRKYFFPLTAEAEYFKNAGVNLVSKYCLREAFDISRRVLCLPLYPDLQMRSVRRIVRIMKTVMDSGS
jgi:dTDP-4-amino-4,6-dideoxygalactose transaminase